VYGDYGADFYSNGIGAMEDYIKEKPEVTRNFVQATMKGLKFTLDHPKEAVGMLKKHQPQLDEEVALQEVEILRNISNAKNLKVLGSMTKEKMQETQDLMIKYMDLKSPVALDQAFTNEFLA
jgi:NitT/TauT family transport system substrate-binding protein